MSVGLEAWLGDRLAEAPAALRVRMVEAVRQRRNGALAAVPGGARAWAAGLRLEADQLLREAAAGPALAGTALTLLAADGLATLACELVAQTEPGALADLK